MKKPKITVFPTLENKINLNLNSIIYNLHKLKNKQPALFLEVYYNKRVVDYRYYTYFVINDYGAINNNH